MPALWDAIEDRLVFGENVSQAAQFATSGATQGGIIAYSLALSPEVSKLGTYALIPDDWHEPLRQRMAAHQGGRRDRTAILRLHARPERPRHHETATVSSFPANPRERPRWIGTRSWLSLAAWRAHRPGVDPAGDRFGPLAGGEIVSRKADRRSGACAAPGPAADGARLLSARGVRIGVMARASL